PSTVGRVFQGLGTIWSLVILLLSMVLTVPLWVNVWRGGTAGGFRLGQIFKLAFSNLGDNLVAWLLTIVAAFIGAVGFIFCFVPGIFTYPLAEAFMAGILFWFARQSGVGPLVPESGPAGGPSGGYPEPQPYSPPVQAPSSAPQPPPAVPPHDPPPFEENPPPPSPPPGQI
ncbi:MAG: hypothetical protein ACREN8_13990, partial [Candidatus Dormibacteraceae bacterium]